MATVLYPGSFDPFHNGHREIIETAAYLFDEVIVAAMRNPQKGEGLFSLEDLRRLPELFCGFTRSAGVAPVAYPVACLPQAWSSGSVFMLMQACLGLDIDGFGEEIRVTRPQLPIGIDQLTIRHLAVGETRVDISFQRIGDRVAAYVEAPHEGLVPLTVRS